MKKVNYIIMIIFLLVLLLSLLVKSKKLLEFDYMILNYIKNIRTIELTKIIKIITDIISIYLVFACAIVIIILKFNITIKLFALINSLGIALLNILIKSVFKITRPLSFMIVKESGYSFPSGHTIVASSFYLFLAYIIYKNVDNKCIRYSIISILIFLIMISGFSRLYLGVHHLTDVIAGLLIGILLLFIEIKYIKEWKYGKSIRS